MSSSDHSEKACLACREFDNLMLGFFRDFEKIQTSVQASNALKFVCEKYSVNAAEIKPHFQCLTK